MEKTAFALLMNDIHVSNNNISEFEKNYREALKICEENSIPYLFVGGDLFQSSSSQTLDVLMAAKRFINDFLDHDIKVVLAEGNHDKINKESFYGYCHLFEDIKNVNVVGDYVTYHNNVFSITIMSYFPENGGFKRNLNSLKKELDKNKKNILYIHEGISGGLSNISDTELSPDVFDDNIFDVVLSGHYHNRCKIKNTNIEYIGSSRQHNFGEDENKGYTILYDDGSYKFVQNKVNVRYCTLDVDKDDIDTLDLKKFSDSDVKVRLRISCKSNEVNNINRQALMESGATKVEIITNDDVSKDANSSSFEQKFDKDGIKDEYKNFCSSKFIDPKMGIEYLNKIN